METIQDSALMKLVLDSLRAMNFNEEDKQAMLRILTSILLLGNIEFDASTVTDTAPCSIKKDAVCKDALRLCAETL